MNRHEARHAGPPSFPALRGRYGRRRRGGPSRGGQAGYVLAMLILTGIAVFLMPRLVDGIAYLTGAGPTATFTAQAARENCDRTGCHRYTVGILEPGGTSVHWPGAVPVGSSFPVRAPAWPTGVGRTIISGTGNAMSAVLSGLVFVVAALLFWAAVGRWAWLVLAWRRSART